MKHSIFPKDFASYYPAGIRPCPMYVEVANRIYEKIKGVTFTWPALPLSQPEQQADYHGRSGPQLYGL